MSRDPFVSGARHACPRVRRRPRPPLLCQACGLSREAEADIRIRLALGESETSIRRDYQLLFQ